MILPEFNSNDEREADITGKAAKDALTAILIFTPIAIIIYNKKLMKHFLSIQ
ncbi:hypothetical protein [Sporosarcina sp. FSL K6-1508]|uniref:hypothetical protein n=1 Tax=Sporosarcina sp. FSL K6-1508 TaxID=2921553 RepID=UPI0030F5C335